ncbi:hypothetical protein A3F37_04065 [Candidatus Saccharibacteria bacterium RIFCSPHIGHO2_12_FULL_41_12]|nr:MAG: hypothetical protein A3F37_04065 [Candidatus Saccharibacteria bacterium RIFCSPHIGHO2_12_FULL_41_12]
MRGQNNLVSNQSGMVAFVVTSFIIIMMSLVVLAFSQNTRREQRQALDRQLSTQAYYTAESAVNETIKYIKDNTAQTPLPVGFKEKKDNCESLTGTDIDKLGGQDSENTFKYTCVMWNIYPKQLVLQELNDQGKIISVNTKDSNLSKLKISWEDVDWKDDTVGRIGFCPTSGNNFSATTIYDCNIGILRASIIPFTGDRTSLIDSTYTVFLRPKNGSTAVYSPHNSGSSTQGNVVGSTCDTKTCSVTINNLPGGNNFLLLKSIYRKSNVTIEGFTAAGVPVEFSEGQIEIDVTARASDIIKRIKVAVPKGHYDRSGYSVEALDGICKKLEVWPTSSTNPCP